MATDSDPLIDWASRADGETHTLVKGKHYTRDAAKVRRAASMWGMRHELRALTDLEPATKTKPERITVRFAPSRAKV